MDYGGKAGDYSAQDPSTAYSVNRGASLSPYLNIDPTYLNQVRVVIKYCQRV